MSWWSIWAAMKTKRICDESSRIWEQQPLFISTDLPHASMNKNPRYTSQIAVSQSRLFMKLQRISGHYDCNVEVFIPPSPPQKKIRLGLSFRRGLNTPSCQNVHSFVNCAVLFCCVLTTQTVIMVKDFGEGAMLHKVTFWPFDMNVQTVKIMHLWTRLVI